MKSIAAIAWLICLLVACSGNPEPADKKQTNTSSTEEITRRKLTEQYPDSLLLRENLIQYYRDSGDYEKALAETEKVLNRDSSNARIWNIKATLQFENEDTLSAVASMEKAVNLQPDAGFLSALGTLYAETRNSKALAVADLLAKKQMSPLADILFLRGLYYSYNGDKLKAISFFDQCLKEDYTRTDAFEEKGIALFELGKYEDALKVFDKAVTIRNNFDEGYYWMGRCCEKLGLTDEAVGYYKTAIQTAQQSKDDNMDARQALERLGVK